MTKRSRLAEEKCPAFTSKKQNGGQKQDGLTFRKPDTNLAFKWSGLALTVLLEKGHKKYFIQSKTV